jgi:HK97 family phage major capsid protein
MTAAPTPLTQLATANTNLEINRKAREFAYVAKWLAIGKGHFGNTLAAAQSSRVTPQMIEAVKAAVQAGTTSDGTWAAPLAYQELSDAFSVSLRNFGVFDAMLPFSIDVPLNMQVNVVTTGVTAASTGEGGVKTISRITLAASTLAARKAVAIIATTVELLRVGGAKAARLFQQELSRAVAAETDSRFLSVISTGITPTASGGSNAFGIATDMATLFAGLTLGVGSKVFIAMSPNDVKHVAVQIANNGERAFPSVTVNGGDYAGATIILTDAVSGQIIAFDATQIAAGSTGIELDASGQATLQMDSAPDSPPTASTNMLSLWQTNNSALRATRYFGCERLRTTAVSVISSVNYGSANSPA